MNIKRALLMSVGLYFATFVSGILIALALGIDLTTIPDFTVGHWIATILVSVAFAFGFSEWYFQNEKATPKEGLYLGLYFLLAGIILDGLFIIPTILIEGNLAILQYYADPWFYVTIALIVATPQIAVYRRKI